MTRAYLTTPLYYVNAEPHLGHTYTTVIADTVARFHRARGDDTFLLTGTDEHGEKILQAAADRGLSPQEHVANVSRLFRDTWDVCHITYDHFIRTTAPEHVRVVQEILSHVHEAGDIYFDSYGGLYCTGCERFYTEKELVGGKCPDHETTPDYVAEENYFFRMSKYQQQLIDYLEQHPETIFPDRYRNEVLSMLRGEVLGDLCISRPKSRLSWGIDLPFDDNYVTYVWFDALINYVSAMKNRGEEQFAAYWPHVEHFIGKDILKPHGIFWPTMLMAAGLPMYHRLNVHGYWTRGESKMSKSLGNVIRPLEMKERFGMDAFRYFLLREMAFGQDATFNEDAFVTRINADLANNLGNLISRTLSMQEKYFDGVVQEIGDSTDDDRQLAAAFDTAIAEVPRFTERLAFHRALESLWRAIDQANKCSVTTAPFRLAKDAGTKPRCGAILRHLLEALYVTAVLLQPFMPDTSERLLGFLGAAPDSTLAPPWKWGHAVAAGRHTAKPEILFPRIEIAPKDS